MIRKPSIFFEEKRLLIKFPYAIVISVILILRILSVFPLDSTGKLLEIGIVKNLVKEMLNR